MLLLGPFPQLALGSQTPLYRKQTLAFGGAAGPFAGCYLLRPVCGHSPLSGLAPVPGLILPTQTDVAWCHPWLLAHPSPCPTYKNHTVLPSGNLLTPGV